MNTDKWNGSGTVPVSNLWCELGLSHPSDSFMGLHELACAILVVS